MYEAQGTLWDNGHILYFDSADGYKSVTHKCMQLKFDVKKYN